MTWHNGRMLGFDVESTGVDAERDRIVTQALVLINPGQQPKIRTELLDPGVEIPAEATAIHGISTERARSDGLPLRMGLVNYADAIVWAVEQQIPLVGFNICYDLTILDRNLRAVGLPSITQRLRGRPLAPVIDALVLDKQVSHRRGRRRLTDCCSYYNVKIEGAHNAAADALAAVRVAWRIASLHPEIAHTQPMQLHQQQVDWRRTQCDSLRTYFDRQGIPHDGVPGDWPMIPYREQSEQLEIPR